MIKMQWIIRRLHTVISTKESGRILRGEISQPVHVREPNRNYTVFKVAGGNTISFCILHYALCIWHRFAMPLSLLFYYTL